MNVLFQNACEAFFCAEVTKEECRTSFTTVGLLDQIKDIKKWSEYGKERGFDEDTYLWRELLSDQHSHPPGWESRDGSFQAQGGSS